jgi:hypothetical protein
METSLLSSAEEIKDSLPTRKSSFWTCMDLFLCISKRMGKVNSDNYCAMLGNELKPAICKKRGMLSETSFCIMTMHVLIQ